MSNIITIEDIVTAKLQVNPTLKNIDLAYVEEITKDAINDVLDFINYKGEELDTRITTPIYDLCVIRLNMTGNEGLTSSSKAGQSESYDTDMPKSIKRKLKKYRNLP